MNYKEKKSKIDRTKKKGGECTREEYSFIIDELERLNGSVVLVFGLGYDSFLYTGINGKGFTVFVEDDSTWIEKMKPHLTDNCLVRKIDYNTKRNQWKELLDTGKEEQLYLDEISFVESYEGNVDFIFVDGPKGGNNRTPGRMRSIYTASVIGKRNNSRVMIHDINREIERRYSETYLEPYSQYRLGLTYGKSRSWIYQF